MVLFDLRQLFKHLSSTLAYKLAIFLFTFISLSKPYSDMKKYQVSIKMNTCLQKRGLLEPIKDQSIMGSQIQIHVQCQLGQTFAGCHTTFAHLCIGTFILHWWEDTPPQWKKQRSSLARMWRYLRPTEIF